MAGNVPARTDALGTMRNSSEVRRELIERGYLRAIPGTGGAELSAKGIAIPRLPFGVSALARDRAGCARRDWAGGVASADRWWVL
jgi:hypothetical protein